MQTANTSYLDSSTQTDTHSYINKQRQAVTRQMRKSFILHMAYTISLRTSASFSSHTDLLKR